MKTKNIVVFLVVAILGLSLCFTACNSLKDDAQNNVDEVVDTPTTDDSTTDVPDSGNTDSGNTDSGNTDSGNNDSEGTVIEDTESFNFVYATTVSSVVPYSANINNYIKFGEAYYYHVETSASGEALYASLTADNFNTYKEAGMTTILFPSNPLILYRFVFE